MAQVVWGNLAAGLSPDQITDIVRQIQARTPGTVWVSPSGQVVIDPEQPQSVITPPRPPDNAAITAGQQHALGNAPGAGAAAPPGQSTVDVAITADPLNLPIYRTAHQQEPTINYDTGEFGMDRYSSGLDD